MSQVLYMNLAILYSLGYLNFKKGFQDKSSSDSNKNKPLLFFWVQENNSLGLHTLTTAGTCVLRLSQEMTAPTWYTNNGH